MQMRSRFHMAVALSVSATAGCGAGGESSRVRTGREIISLPGALATLPFSTAVRVGGMIYLSGQVGVSDDTGSLVEGGVGPETRQTLENIRSVLEFAGSSLTDVVKCTVFLKDISHYAAMNEVYASFFPENPPARSTVAGSGLALNALVEIECIAAVEG